MSERDPGVLLIVSAPSGGGKSTLTRHYVQQSAASDRPAALSVSYTTRAPRPGEINGVHYHFVDDEQFDEMIAEHAFIEHAEVFGRRYGTGRAVTETELEVGRDVILDIDWQGARQVRACMPEAVGVFILP
ncbi:MAG: guanylate kinase, partial [Algiphilus sp.]